MNTSAIEQRKRTIRGVKENHKKVEDLWAEVQETCDHVGRVSKKYFGNTLRHVVPPTGSSHCENIDRAHAHLRLGFSELTAMLSAMEQDIAMLEKEVANGN
jgi:hypothetical protein